MPLKKHEIEEIKIKLAEQIRTVYGQEAYDHLRLNNGVSFAAVDDKKVIGFISIFWEKLPHLSEKLSGAYINIIEVDHNYRRQGIAKELINKCIEAAKAEGCYQLRSWSSEDKIEAISMWKKLGFGLHPQTIISSKTKQKVNGYFVTKPL